MDVVEAFAFVALFFGIYGAMLLIGYVIDTVLRRVFKKGIFPEGYFKW